MKIVNSIFQEGWRRFIPGENQNNFQRNITLDLIKFLPLQPLGLLLGRRCFPQSESINEPKEPEHGYIIIDPMLRGVTGRSQWVLALKLGQGLLRIKGGGTRAHGLGLFVLRMLDVFFCREGAGAMNMGTESPIVESLARVMVVGMGVGMVVASRPEGKHINVVVVRVSVARKETDEREEIFIINAGLAPKEVLSIKALIVSFEVKRIV